MNGVRCRANSSTNRVRPSSRQTGSSQISCSDLQQNFTATRTNLKRQWDGHNDISTEELRVAMTRYRSFFERLLST